MVGFILQINGAKSNLFQLNIDIIHPSPSIQIPIQHPPAACNSSSSCFAKASAFSLAMVAAFSAKAAVSNIQGITVQPRSRWGPWKRGGPGVALKGNVGDGEGWVKPGRLWWNWGKTFKVFFHLKFDDIWDGWRNLSQTMGIWPAMMKIRGSKKWPWCWLNHVESMIQRRQTYLKTFESFGGLVPKLEDWEAFHQMIFYFSQKTVLSPHPDSLHNLFRSLYFFQHPYQGAPRYPKKTYLDRDWDWVRDIISLYIYIYIYTEISLAYQATYSQEVAKLHITIIIWMNDAQDYMDLCPWQTQLIRGQQDVSQVPHRHNVVGWKAHPPGSVAIEWGWNWGVSYL